MIKRLTLLLALSLVWLNAWGSFEDLPPPPGYVDPNPKPRVRPSPRARSGLLMDPQPRMMPRLVNGKLVMTDRRGDISQNHPVAYMDLVQLSLSRLNETDIGVEISFNAPMPLVAKEDEYVDVFVSLDLDKSVTTGKNFDGLGIDQSIKFKGFDQVQPWTWKTTPHSEFAVGYGISVVSAAYADDTLYLVIRAEGPQRLESFGLQVGATANYQPVDQIPNNPPLYVDLRLLDH